MQKMHISALNFSFPQAHTVRSGDASCRLRPTLPHYETPKGQQCNCISL